MELASTLLRETEEEQGKSQLWEEWYMLEDRNDMISKASENAIIVVVALYVLLQLGEKVVLTFELDSRFGRRLPRNLGTASSSAGFLFILQTLNALSAATDHMQNSPTMF